MEFHKRHHFVPQFYLKNWSKDGKCIWMHRLIVSNNKVPEWEFKSIKNIAYYKDLYTGNIENNISDEIEKWFDKEIENPCKKIFDDIRVGRKIGKEKYLSITKFMIAQHIRTPKFFKKGIPRWEETIMDTIKDINLKDKSLESTSYIDEEYIRFKKYVPIRVKTEESDKRKVAYKIETSIGKGNWLYAIDYIYNCIVPKLPQYKWSILQAPSGFQWPTSDNPVILLNYYGNGRYDFKGGWGNKGTEIIMPVTPSHILMTHVGESMPSYQNINVYTAKVLRKFIIENADHTIYAKAKIKNIYKLRNRQEGHELYHNNINGFRTFLDEQLKVEAGIIKSKSQKN